MSPTVPAAPGDIKTDAPVIVSIGDMKAASGSRQIVTHALGSCLGLTLWDPQARVGAMLHAMLPSSRFASDSTRNNPFLFVDTGVPAAFRQCYEMGADKSRIVCVAAGCASVLTGSSNDVFQIGLKNLRILDALLDTNGIATRARDVGGSHARTLTLNVQTGEVTVRFGREVRTL